MQEMTVQVFVRIQLFHIRQRRPLNCLVPSMFVSSSLK